MLLLLRAYSTQLCCREQMTSGMQLFGTRSVCIFQGNVRMGKVQGESNKFVFDFIEQDCLIELSL